MHTFRNMSQLNDWLLAKGVDTSSWGKNGSKTVTHLWQEYTRGEVSFQDSPPLRRVNVVQLNIRRDNQVLIEAAQEFCDGRLRHRNQPPSEKMKPGESYIDAALRCCQEELGVSPERVQIIPDTHKIIDVETESISYPGLKTQYTFHIVDATIKNLPESAFWKENEVKDKGDPIRRHYWVWQTV
ncbi:MAG: NUDIX hydrolase [Chloroflexi bacterium]|nr:MAG: NUDIX hydrolase [Chloroflexota bacterium]